MSNIVITDNGKIRRVEDVEFAEKVVGIKNKKDHWAVIEELVSMWAKRSPDDVEAVRINLSEYREAAIDKKYGQTAGGHDQERRLVLAFPYSLQQMIRTVLKAEELPFDREFYAKFAKKYPFFQVPDKM